MHETYLSVRQAAEIKGCSRQTIYNALERDAIHSAKIGAYRYVVNDDAFDAWTVQRKHDPRRNPLPTDHGRENIAQ